MSETKTNALRRTLQETALYPPHPPRKPTALYSRSHHDLVKVKDLPCLVCGVRNSTLGNSEHNPWGAKAIETHHHVVEDSLALAIDLAKFNKRVLPGLLKRSGNQRYAVDFTQAQMEEWIHGDPDNLYCICDVHHRHPLVGVHSITFPIWSVQDLLLDGYDLTGFKAYSVQEASALTALPTTTGKAIVPVLPKESGK